MIKSLNILCINACNCSELHNENLEKCKNSVSVRKMTPMKFKDFFPFKKEKTNEVEEIHFQFQSTVFGKVNDDELKFIIDLIGMFLMTQTLDDEAGIYNVFLIHALIPFMSIKVSFHFSILQNNYEDVKDNSEQKKRFFNLVFILLELYVSHLEMVGTFKINWYNLFIDKINSPSMFYCDFVDYIIGENKRDTEIVNEFLNYLNYPAYNNIMIPSYGIHYSSMASYLFFCKDAKRVSMTFSKITEDLKKCYLSIFCKKTEKESIVVSSDFSYKMQKFFKTIEIIDYSGLSGTNSVKMKVSSSDMGKSMKIKTIKDSIFFDCSFKNEYTACSEYEIVNASANIFKVSLEFFFIDEVLRNQDQD